MSGRLKVLDLWVDPVDMEGALERVRGFVEAGDGAHCVFAVNPEKNFSVPKDPELHRIFREADLLIPDGIGVVLGARILHGAKLKRVPGVELMANVCRLSAERGWGIFVFGAQEEVNRDAVAELERRYAGLRIVGRQDGYVQDDEMPDVVHRINSSGAQVLFLALGSPKQEKWYTTYRDQLSTVRVVQGIGGSLDTITGAVKRAPAMWCRLGLEWLYRLLAEPTRVKRQKVLPLFVLRLAFEKAKRTLGAGTRQSTEELQKTGANKKK
ncbi:MAG: WecB/TagA/CpsF family glycosyltransferase [Deferrisomatales bacterium]|nr:WecB/TagA/CpsF family glycosyltransferase [Deferrisomatales bacterium]